MNNKKNGEEIKRIEIWNGYFSTILSGMIQEGSEPVGMLHEYIVHEGWYESDEPWEIPDIQQAIDQIHEYKEENLIEDEKNMRNVLPDIPEVLERILKFLEEAREDGGEVYIEYL